MIPIEKHLEVVLDNICRNGCTYVRECISKMQSDEIVTEVKSINSIEKQIILQELISIMNVYDTQKN